MLSDDLLFFIYQLECAQHIRVCQLQVVYHESNRCDFIFPKMNVIIIPQIRSFVKRQLQKMTLQNR